MIEKITNQNQIARHKLAEKINELIDAVNSIVSVQEKLIDSRFVVETENTETAFIKTMRMDKEFAEEEMERLRQELDRTKKQLEIAVDALNEIDKNLITVVEMTWRAKMALEKINDIDKGE